MNSTTKKVLLFSFIAFSAFAQVWGGGGGSVTASGNVTYMPGGTNGKASTVQTALREQIFADQYNTVTDAIAAANGKQLVFGQGVYTCTGLTWGSSGNVLVVIQPGADLTACTLPAADSLHWIIDYRAGYLDASKTKGVKTNITNQYLLSTDATGTVVGTSPIWDGTKFTSKVNDKGGTVYNVKAYGAKCDGSTNDASAIQSAITDAPPGGTIYFPGCASSYVVNTQLTLTALNLRFVGDGWNSKISNTSGVRLFALVSPLSSEVFSVENLWIDGGAGVIIVPDNSQNSSIKITNSKFSNQTDVVFQFGTSIGSAYIARFVGNMFYTNGGTNGVIRTYPASDLYVENNFFLQNTTIPIISGSEDLHVLGNYFIANQTAEADVQILPAVDGHRFAWISHNKFGNESEVIAHYKIEVGTSALKTSNPQYVASQLYITNNYFGTVTGQTVIRAYHRMLHSIVGQNTATNSVIWINDDDAFTSGLGDSIFSNNACLSEGSGYCAAFVNNGKGFAISDNRFGPEPSVDQTDETAPMNNLFTYSETFTNAAWVKTGLTVGATVSNPFGLSTAYTLTGSGTGSQNIGQFVTLTSTGPWSVAVWLKGGTETNAQIEAVDTTNSTSLARQAITLGPNWKRYTVKLLGGASGDGVSIYVRLPDGSNKIAYIYGASVNPGLLAASYVPTVGAAVTGSNGKRFVNDIQVGRLLSMSGLTFANLGTPTNGTFVYCSDCTVAATCAASGSGALAKRLAGAWVCN